MPKITQLNEIDISPEKYLSNCSDIELQELDLLLQTAYYQIRMYGTHIPEAKVKVTTQKLIEE